MPTVALFVSASPACAQRLELPPRSAGAVTGSAFAREIAALPPAEREGRILAEILSGNVPAWLRELVPVEIERAGRTAITLWVTPDYLSVGSAEDHLLMPMMPGTAQRIADETRMSLPTPRIVDAVWSTAPVKLTPAPIPPSEAMTTVPVFAAHADTVAARRNAVRAPAGTLTSGHKKDVVISAGVAAASGHVAIYGWHEPSGQPIQPLYLGHTDDWVDYSHGIRLVSRRILVDGAPVDLLDALRNPALASALSREGVIERPRYDAR